MDKELQTYTDQIMDQQQYRSGIFSNVMSPILNAMAAVSFLCKQTWCTSLKEGYLNGS